LGEDTKNNHEERHAKFPRRGGKRNLGGGRKMPNLFQKPYKLTAGEDTTLWGSKVVKDWTEKREQINVLAGEGGSKELGSSTVTRGENSTRKGERKRAIKRNRRMIRGEGGRTQPLER